MAEFSASIRARRVLAIFTHATAKSIFLKGDAARELTPRTTIGELRGRAYVYLKRRRGAYRSMIQEEDNQCVIISGESGAGKTEASKQIQNYIAGVSGGGAGVDKVKQIFLQSNPLLEAFGNAKTLRNNNSSRFGKYFELKFDRVGTPRGGVVTNYLLEKSRIVKPGKNERNFHAFYQLLSAPNKVRSKLKVTSAEQYSLTRGCVTVDGVDDASEFNETITAMKAVTMRGKEIEVSLKMVATVVHMGNIKFSASSENNAEGSVLSDQGTSALQLVCKLCGVDDGALVHALTHRQLHTMAPGGKIETYEVPLNPSQAAASRDAVAKTIYSRLFDFLVRRVNDALAGAEPWDQTTSRMQRLPCALRRRRIVLYGELHSQRRRLHWADTALSG